MLRTAKDLEGCTIEATDGAIGSVEDFYFDDDQWVVRYIVVKTGNWFGDRGRPGVAHHGAGQEQSLDRYGQARFPPI